LTATQVLIFRTRLGSVSDKTVNGVNVSPLILSSSAYAIIFSKKHEKLSQERIANLGPYLHKAYGNDIGPSLST